jgi:hypothetical protein
MDKEALFEPNDILAAISDGKGGIRFDHKPEDLDSMFEMVTEYQ